MYLRRHVRRGIGVPAVDDKVHIFELYCREKVSLLMAGENGGELFPMTVPAKCAAPFFDPLFGALPMSDVCWSLAQKCRLFPWHLARLNLGRPLSPFRWHPRLPQRKLGRTNQTDNLNTAL